MNLYNFKYTKSGLKAQINKDELAELLKKDEDARIENAEYKEECDNNRSYNEQCEYDSGTCDSDFL